ncbi:DUF4231 domain-containing protein [Raoultella planticola]|uniref:DUF4231 domain-containing protein n=1 Tax=Raoultella planticola TaxID=575 RepID=UPI00388DE05F
MTQQLSDKILVGMINSAIDCLKTKTKRNKRRFQIFTGLSIVLGAAITLTLGLEMPEMSRIQKNVALLLGVSLTIINSWLAVFDYKKLWMRQKITLLALYQLKNYLIYLKGTTTGCTQKDLDQLFQQYQDIWEKDSSEWFSIHNQIAETKNNMKESIN